MSKTSQHLIQRPIVALICATLLGLNIPVDLSAENRKSVPVRPAIVVGIMVEGLNEDYLTVLYDYFTDGGFKRLIDNGVTISNVDYGPNVDATAAAAILYTGASPSVNGIPGKQVYDPNLLVGQDTMLDPEILGNFTDETYSPKAIKVSTLADEIRIDADGTGYVYSIVPNHQRSIISAGHAGNSAFWITDHTGKWATTTHYKDVPTPIATHNYQEPLTSVIDTAQWSPVMDLTFYPDIPDYQKPYPFRNNFPRRDVDRFKAFKASPIANREVTDMAIDYISTLKLGQRGVIDMLNLGYNVAPYPYSKMNDTRLETLDSYLRLDRDLNRLFSAIDKHVGSGNALIFVAGLPAPPPSKREDEKWGLPTGQFSTRKAMALLNAYLIGLHSNGEWVTGYHNGNFYLNHKLIRERDLDVATVRREAADFLVRMSGVSDVYTIDDVLAGTAGDNGVALRRNTDIASAGDIVIHVTPGWELLDDRLGATTVVASETFTPSPTYIFWPHVEAKTISTPVDARVIAPTIARVLRIRSPNAASQAALRLD